MNFKNKYAPICLFTYNRLNETRRTVKALQLNELARESDLFIFSDGPKNEKKTQEIIDVREYINSIRGFKKVTIFESKINKGLANSITEGVTKVVNEFGRVIVLEDDIVTSKGFLVFMNDSLNFYESKKEVMQVSSFMFPIDSHGLPDTFFYQANTCWGWGTWKRAWDKYNDDGHYLMEQIKLKGITWKEFNSLQGKEFQKQLLRNLNGSMKTWAVKWHSAIKLNKGKVLHPKTSYVLNIGFSGNGENCSKGASLGIINNELKLDVSEAENIDGNIALERLNEYFKKRYSLFEKCKRKIKSYL